MSLDVERFADHVIATIKGALSPVLTRLSALELREPIAGKDGAAGIGIAAAVVAADGRLMLSLTNGLVVDAGIVKGMKGNAGERGERGESGQQGKVGLIGPEGQTGATGPQVERGESMQGEPGPQGPEGSQGSVGPQGEKGDSVSLADLRPLIIEEVTKAFAVVPVAKDGVSITPKDVAPMIAEEVARAVKALPQAKDGTGISGALIDRTGNLVLTFSDGSTKEVGAVIGRDVDFADVQRFITEELAKWPKPEPGPPGRDGTLENIKIDYDNERTAKFCFKDGTLIEGGELRFPLVLDRGVYKAGEVYEQGDGVSWGGDFWIAQTTTKAKPGTELGEQRTWRLAVRRGSEGKKGLQGPEGPMGKTGPQGPQGSKGY